MTHNNPTPFGIIPCFCYYRRPCSLQAPSSTNICLERQQNLYAKRVEERNEATRQREKWNEEIKAKLQRDIKRAREQQVAELRAQKKQAK